MLISVITPTKNSAKFLKNCIESVKRQTTKAEHIIIDGGSADDTFSLLKEYDHIKWLSEPDKGMYDAINKGLNIAQGEIIGYLNADDRYCSNTFSDILHVFENNPEVDFIYGDCIYIDHNEKALYTHKPLPYFNKLLKNMKEIQWAQPSCFWRKAVHQKIGKFDPALRYIGDYDFFLRLIINNCKGFRIKKPLCFFMLHNGSLSVKARKEMREEHENLIKKYNLNQNPILNIIGKIYFKLINIYSYIGFGYIRYKLSLYKNYKD